MAEVRTDFSLKYKENLSYREELLRLHRIANITMLARSIAHDINNFIGAIVGYTDMLHAKLSENEEALLYAGKILEASQQTTKLTRTLLQYSRTASQGISAVNVKELLEDVLLLYKDKDLKIYLQSGEDVPEIQTDRAQLKQALSNIILSAGRAGGLSGRGDDIVTVAVHAGQLPPEFGGLKSSPVLSVIISISGIGNGMDEELPKSIESWGVKPLRETLVEQMTETKLRLLTAYIIIQRLKGGIHVEQKSDNGLTIHIYLPTK